MIKELKEKIKQYSLEQKDLKNQRKTKYLVGERRIDPFIALDKIISNKVIITEMLITYLYIRGKHVELVYKNLPGDYYTTEYLEKLKKIYCVVV